MTDIIQQLEEHLDQNIRISNGKPQAGVLVPFFEKSGVPHILLTERSTKLRKHSGQISFPGGKIELQDKNIIETALRETHEEIGLKRDQIQLLGKFHDFATPYYSCVTPIIGVFEYPVNYKIEEAEIEKILEVPVSDLLDDTIYHNEVWEHQGEKYRIHFYNWTDKDDVSYNIWGATAGVLNKILEVLSPVLNQSDL